MDSLVSDFPRIVAEKRKGDALIQVGPSVEGRGKLGMAALCIPGARLVTLNWVPTKLDTPSLPERHPCCTEATIIRNTSVSGQGTQRPNLWWEIPELHLGQYAKSIAGLHHPDYRAVHQIRDRQRFQGTVPDVLTIASGGHASTHVLDGRLLERIIPFIPFIARVGVSPFPRRFVSLAEDHDTYAAEPIVEADATQRRHEGV